jgi:hypothetical protein
MRSSQVHHETILNPRVQDKEKKSRYRKHRLQTFSFGFLVILMRELAVICGLRIVQLPDVLSLI